MATKPRAKGPIAFTPAAPFVWPTLNAASDKFKEDGEFNVKVRMIKDSEGFKALADKLDPLHRKAVAAGEIAFNALPVASRKKLKELTINPWFSEVFDETTEEPTGEVEVKFAMQATRGPFKNGKNAGKFGAYRPTVIDAAKAVIIPGFEFKMVDTLEEAQALTFKSVGPRIWGGTIGRVKFEVALNKDEEVGYFIPGTGACGISLKPIMVQVIELVTGSGGEADTSGFDEEEGYRAGGSEGAADEASDASDEGADF